MDVDLIAGTPDGKSPRILVVDDEPSILELLAEALELDGFGVQSAPSARSALALLRTGEVDLILADINMPHEDGLWLLRVARSQYRRVPVIMMTGLQDTRTAVACLREGAADYLAKPLDLDEMRIAVRRALHRHHLERENQRYRRDLEWMVLDRTRELRRALDQRQEANVMLLEALVHALDAREQDTHNHSLRVASYTAAIVQEMGVCGDEVSEIYKGALLHDVGKIGIPDSILLKPGPLDEAEWEVMRSHPIIGARILDGIPFLEGAREIVLSHHERWDGQGYPGGLAGSQIPLGARIFAVADTFDVMTSGRPYRGPIPVEEVEEEVRRCSGSQFDPEVARLFSKMLHDGKLTPRRVMTDAIPEDLHHGSWARPRRPELDAATGA